MLLRHLVSEFFSVGGLLLMFRVRVLMIFASGLLYFLSPFDIIPEAVYGLFGLLDDVFIVLLLLIYLTILYRRHVSGRGEAE